MTYVRDQRKHARMMKDPARRKARNKRKKGWFVPTPFIGKGLPATIAKKLRRLMGGLH